MLKRFRFVQRSVVASDGVRDERSDPDRHPFYATSTPVRLTPSLTCIFLLNESQDVVSIDRSLVHPQNVLEYAHEGAVDIVGEFLPVVVVRAR